MIFDFSAKFSTQHINLFLNNFHTKIVYHWYIRTLFQQDAFKREEKYALLIEDDGQNFSVKNILEFFYE